ncbi:leucine-rich repeat flightless-interacting protein 2-like [Simochromis diagramma]|uniref:leucine-rich repeat flightless-interacting protein 2-like n=1 Tax=Simochromis diagramma TaxID=43689 RepID=UPI001A7E8529|nr:leucine-rich repeat flightless-interacting protein 2-like [Simochromis diagramma]
MRVWCRSLALGCFRQAAPCLPVHGGAEVSAEKNFLKKERVYRISYAVSAGSETEDRHKKVQNTENDGLENGMDSHLLELQRDANRQISDLKFKLVKSEQEVTTLEQNVIRLEGQVSRYKGASENAEKIEDELKGRETKAAERAPLSSGSD